MSKNIQEELLGVLWFILAVLLWKYGCRILWILAFVKGCECTFWSICFAIIGAINKFKAIQAFKKVLEETTKKSNEPRNQT